jgi:hypothetical protein
MHDKTVIKKQIMLSWVKDQTKHSSFTGKHKNSQISMLGAGFEPSIPESQDNALFRQPDKWNGMAMLLCCGDMTKVLLLKSEVNVVTEVRQNDWWETGLFHPRRKLSEHKYVKVLILCD